MNEKCVWTIHCDSAGEWYSIECRKYDTTYYEKNNQWKYCPYCGREIEVKK